MQCDYDKNNMQSTSNFFECLIGQGNVDLMSNSRRLNSKNALSNWLDDKTKSRKLSVGIDAAQDNENQKHDVQMEKLNQSQQQQYRQASIRPFCKVTQRETLTKRTALNNITNCFDSPKSRISTKANIVKKPSPLFVDENRPTRKRTFTENDIKVEDEQKRCKNSAVSKNVLNHIDISTIPLSARALHRVHSSSILETSWHSDKDSPDQFDTYSLITVKKPQIPNGAFASISGETLKDLLQSMSDEDFLQKFVLVDCRYPYEYNGGHIKNAINMYDPADVIAFFYPDDRTQFLAINSKIPIFYCEYSQKRGPTMAMELRRLDRQRNQNRYPNIDYKEIYILDCGYKQFFSEDKHVELCNPQNYIPMLQPEYLAELTSLKFHKKHYNGTEIKNQRIPFGRNNSIDSVNFETMRFADNIDKYKALKEEQQNIQKKQQRYQLPVIHSERKRKNSYGSISTSSTEESFMFSNESTSELTNRKISTCQMQQNFSMMTVSSPLADCRMAESLHTTPESDIISSSPICDGDSSPFSIFSRRSLFNSHNNTILTASSLRDYSISP